MDELSAASAEVYSELKNLVAWAKTNGGMGTFYRSRHELIFVYKVGTAKHLNTFGLGETGRYRTNVWDYPGVNSFGGNQEDLALHGDIVLDGFGGSGTTLIAAERTARVARLVELDPLYCDVICRRFEAHTGQPARLAGTDQTFSDVARERESETDTPIVEAAE
jgi:hypothetical protein